MGKGRYSKAYRSMLQLPGHPLLAARDIFCGLHGFVESRPTTRAEPSPLLA
jgi:hypothetical protein